MPSSPELLTLWTRSVNCTPEQIEEWHTTAESAAVGTRRPGDVWSVGQLAGQRTVELLETPPAEWTEADRAHVRRVAGFVRRHRAQWPRGDVRASRWRHSLRNWGHDPLWEGRLDLRGPAGGEDPVGASVLVDGTVVGRAQLEPGDDGGVLVHRVDLEEAWRGRGIGPALLHRLAVDHRGAVVVVRPDSDATMQERLRRLHLTAPTPDAPLLHLHGW